MKKGNGICGLDTSTFYLGHHLKDFMRNEIDFLPSYDKNKNNNNILKKDNLQVN